LAKLIGYSRGEGHAALERKIPPLERRLSPIFATSLVAPLGGLGNHHPWSERIITPLSSRWPRELSSE